jgi:hypothetical protein
MKFYFFIKLIIYLILLFDIYISSVSSIKLSFISDPLIQEDLLIKKYFESLTDTRQRKLFFNKFFDHLHLTRSQRKKAQSEEVFFEDFSSHMNEYSIYSKSSKDYDNFKYLTYTEIEQELKDLSSKFSNLMELTTAQSLYKIPNPLGLCNDQPCSNFIVFLGNKLKMTKESPQMFISCALHGDEKVGPTLCTEFIKLIVENYSRNKWVKFLLDNRSVIITPMTNAYGYYLGMRVRFFKYFLYFLLRKKS